MNVAKSMSASLFLSLLSAPLLVVGCSSDDNNPTVTENGKVISSVEIDGEKSLSQNQEEDYKAEVKYSDGTSKSISTDDKTIWNTTDSSTLTISKTGKAKAIKIGITEISVSYEGIKKSKTIAVTP